MTIFSYIMGSILTAAPLIVGLLLIFCPPKKVNKWCGIKTKATSKNQETWDYGHKICARTLLVYSVFSILAFVLILFLIENFLNDYWYLRIIVGLAFALLGVAIAGITTEVKTLQFGKHFANPEKSQDSAE